MSAAARSIPARSVPTSRPATESRPRLRAVAAPEQARSLAPFAWTCIAIILVALVAVLIINTAMAEGAYERRDLKIEIANLTQERSRLVSELEVNASPSRLADAAKALGMEPAEARGFVSLDNAEVLENGVSASGDAALEEATD